MSIPQYTCLAKCTNTVIYAYLCWIFMLIPHPSNCVQQQPLLKNRVLRYLLIDHQRIEQQHQRSQAKDSFAKTCQTQFDMQRSPGAVSDYEYPSNLWHLFSCSTCLRQGGSAPRCQDIYQGAKSAVKVVTDS